MNLSMQTWFFFAKIQISTDGCSSKYFCLRKFVFIPGHCWINLRRGYYGNIFVYSRLPETFWGLYTNRRVWNNDGMTTTKTEMLEEKPALLLFCPPLTSREITREKTQLFTVRSQHLITRDINIILWLVLTCNLNTRSKYYYFHTQKSNAHLQILATGEN